MPTPPKVHPHSSTAAAGTSESPDDFAVYKDDAAFQEATTSVTQVLQVIDSAKEKVEADRRVVIQKIVEENRLKVAEITHNRHQLAVERRKLGSISGGKSENLLTKKQKAAIDLQNGVDVNSSQNDERGSVILLGSGITVENSVRPIFLPKMEIIPRYTTWIFLKRNQRMTEDQSVVGRRRIYYDHNGGEALVCSDSEEEFINEEEDKEEFVQSEDNIIRMTIEQVGASDIVFDALSQRMSRKPCEVKGRYEALVSRKNAMERSESENTDSKMSSILDKDLEAALDTFDKLFCRRCYIFDCKLHGCSQELIIPAKRQSWNGPYEENVPCSPHCYLKLEGNAGIPPMQLNTEQTTHIESEASGVQASGGASPRKSLKSCKSASASSNAKNDAQSSIDSDTRPLRDDSTHRSPSPNNSKRLRRIATTRSRRKDSFIPPTSVQLTATNYTRKKNKFLNENTSRHITHFECWRTLEKSLFEKGMEMFGRNSCLIARNLLYSLKTCVEVFHALKYYESKSFQGSNNTSSLNDGCMVESNQNMGSGSRILHKRGRGRGLKYTWKSGGSNLMRKRISHKKNMTCYQYHPCGCQSTCGDDCSCLANGTCCEKYCGCPKTCKNRFRGCHCAKSQCRSRQCPCFAANRECDPDICRHCWISCDDGSLGSPEEGDNYECKNINLLIGKQQRIMLGRSEVSGWGAFIKNTIAKDEYLGEYTGELISHHEADKRGKIYDRENSSFLFNLNDQYVVDANRKGNKLKFANHSPLPNCYAKVMMVGGEHRVGIFAKEKICAGEELFYDYRYEADSAPAWAKKPDSCDSGKEDTPSSCRRAKKLA